MFYIVMSNSKSDLKTEAIIQRNWCYPVTTECIGTKSVRDIIAISKTYNHRRERKRSLITNVNKNVKSLKRKLICTKETTCTPFFIRRATTKKQAPLFKYPIPPHNSESLFTDNGSFRESLVTKRGKLKNFFFPKVSSIGTDPDTDTNIYAINGTKENLTTLDLEYKGDSIKNLTIEKNTNCSKPAERENFQQASKQLERVDQTETDHVLATKKTVEVPSTKLDLGLCSGEPKELMKETANQRATTNLSLTISRQSLKPEHETEKPITTSNFLQRFKLKMLTFNSLKQATQISYLNSTLNNRTILKTDDCWDIQSSKERTPGSCIGTTGLTTIFFPYTKFQVKDLFNFKDRPASELSNIKSATDVINIDSVTNKTKSLANIKNIFAFSKSLPKSTMLGTTFETKQTSKNLKPLLTTTESENEYEIIESVNFDNTPCECSVDYDDLVSEKTNNVYVEMNQQELGITEAMGPDLETITSQRFSKLRNLFDRKKLNLTSNSNGRNLSHKGQLLHQRLKSNHHSQKFPNLDSNDSTASVYNSPLFAYVPQERIPSNTFSLTNPLTLTTSNSFDGISPHSVNNDKKPSTKKPLSLRTKPEPNTPTTNKRDSFNLRNVLHLQRKPKLELSPNLNETDSEEYWTEYPSSTTNFIPQVPSSSSNQSLVDMNPEEFYQNFEKSTTTIYTSDSLLVRKQKPNLKQMFSFMKKMPRLNTMDQAVNDQNDRSHKDSIKSEFSNRSKTEVEEEYGYHPSIQRSTNIRLNHKKPSTTSQTFQRIEVEYSDEPLQGSSTQFSDGTNAAETFFSTEEGTVTVEKETRINQCTYNYSKIPSLEGGLAQKILKLKSVIGLHKPVSSNNSKVVHNFDPGGLPYSDKDNSQAVKTNFVGGFESSTTLSTKENGDETQQYRFTEPLNTDATKPVGWWLFWNQPKVTFNGLSQSNVSKSRLFGTKRNYSFGWHSTKATMLQNTTRNPSDVSGDSCFNRESTQLLLQNKEVSSNRKICQESHLLKLSTETLPSVLKHKEANINISDKAKIKTKFNLTSSHNCSIKTIHSSINVISLNTKKRVYKPFERVLNTPQPVCQGNASKFDAKNLSYFIQNLTHSSNNTRVDSKQVVLSSNLTKENLKLDLLNKTSISGDNMTSANDSSFSIMAYVLRPFESLISVFKGKSTQNMTKVGDVNASDIHNGSIPSHLHPQNSSLVILALNNTNSTSSKETHEPKVGLFDVLGGWFHCIMETYVEPNPRDIHFYLFTRNNTDTPEELFLTEESVEHGNEENVTDVPTPVWESQSSSESERKKRQADDEDIGFEGLNFATSELESRWFNLLDETKILIHGYIQDYQTDIIVNMKDAFLKKGAFNVIVVDWSTVGDNTCYPSVAEHGLTSVGRLLSRLLDQLVAGGVSLARVHVVGFSLGAHVAGIAGTNTRGLLSRITGLDPALPYVPMDPEVCLDAGDAVFVDIIHSAAGYLGQPGPTGHVDFYPNGGSQQPGCDLASLGACSHRRSALYFIESITSEVGFRATPCDSWHDFLTGRCNSSSGADLLMGEPCPTNASGKYFLRTGHKEPFALLAEEHSKVKKSLLLDIFYELV